MLDSMRTLSKSIVSKLLMGFLVLSFGVWGVGDILRSGGASYAVKVGDEVVSASEFKRQAQLLKQQVESAGMKNLPPGTIEKSVLQQLVQERLNRLAVKDLGLYANDVLAAQKIAGMKEFKDKKTGKFSADVYRSAIQNSGLRETAFIDSIKQETAIKFLNDSLAMQDAVSPQSVLQLNALVAGETRDVVLLTVPAKAAVAAHDPEALQRFYEQNKLSLYMTPEARTLEYLTLNKSDLDAFLDSLVTDQAVEDLLAAKPELNKSLARMKLRDEQKDKAMHELSNRLEDELAAGKTLAEAASAAGLRAAPKTLSNTTKLAGQMSIDPVQRTAIEKGFAMGEGETSDLISTPNGAMLMIAVKAVAVSEPVPFEIVAADVAQRLAKSQAREAAQEKAVEIRKALAESRNWQAVAGDYNLSSRALSRISRPAESKAAPANLPPALHQAIFDKKLGDVAGPLALESGDQVLALVTKSYLPDATSLVSTKQNEPDPAADRLARDIENRAHLSFAKRHKVDVNEAILSAGTSAE